MTQTALRKATRFLALGLVCGVLTGCNLLNQTVVISAPGMSPGQSPGMSPDMSPDMSKETRDKVPAAKGQTGAEHHLAVGLSALVEGMYY